MSGNLINLPGVHRRWLERLSPCLRVEGALMLGVPPVSARAKRGQSRKYAKESILILTILRDLND